MAVKLSALRAGHLLPPGRSWYSVRGWVDPQGHSAAGRITSVEKSLFGNRTRDLLKFVDTFKFGLQSNRNNGYVTWRPTCVSACISSIIRSVFVGTKNVLSASYRKMNPILYPIHFSPESYYFRSNWTRIVTLCMYFRTCIFIYIRKLPIFSTAKKKRKEFLWK
jgi:hypothetical protein